jgi:hypothetical protein
MIEHKYILEPYKGMITRYRCPAPNCCKGKTFSLYIDTETGEHIHPTVGRCNRESNCGHHYTPKQYFQDNNILLDTPHPKAIKLRPPISPQTKPVSFVPIEVFKASLNTHEVNHFVKFLIKLFGVDVAIQLVSRYFIASSKHWNGSTVFWQIDTQGKVRTGKIMLYSPTTGKRIKEPFNHINWVHSILKQPEFELKQCLFGEHLLIDRTKPVAIVESEKTAVIASVYLPQFIWVAVGSLTNLNAEKCTALMGRTVTLFPDLNGFDKWSSKANELSHIAKFTISNLLENKANEIERKQGLDLADYLIKFNYKDFAIVKSEANEIPQAIHSSPDKNKSVEFQSTIIFDKHQYPMPVSWGQEIDELENYFKSIELPNKPIHLNQCSLISDIPLFINGHISILRTNDGKQVFMPYLKRLKELKQILETF